MCVCVYTVAVSEYERENGSARTRQKRDSITVICRTTLSMCVPYAWHVDMCRKRHSIITCCDDDEEDDDDDEDEVSFMLLLVVAFSTFWRVLLSLCFCWRFSSIDDISGVEFAASASDISGIYETRPQRKTKWEHQTRV